jgi:hypothetical protein
MKTQKTMTWQIMAALTLALSLLAANLPATAETRYLAFQVFTGSPNTAEGFDASPVLSGIPSRAAIAKVAEDVIGKIGKDTMAQAATGHRVALILGPLAFDQSDDETAKLIADGFDIALEKNIAIGFHIDDAMFWGRHADLLSNPANIERPGWNDPSPAFRRLDWGPQPTKIPPSMCMNSPGIEKLVTGRATLIGASLKAGMAKLHTAQREDLYAGVIAGWESQIGRAFPDNTPLGFCALQNRGFKPGATESNLFDARVAVVADFITLWATGLAAAGVPEAKIYSHVAFTLRDSHEPKANFAPPSVAFGAHRRAGFSTYPTLGLIGELSALVQEKGGAPWASSEGANLLLVGGAMDSGMNMETYLAQLFNHGAAVVNVFGWGLGDPDYPFRKAAERSEALAAYRKFLMGGELVEGPVAETILDRVRHKLAEIQSGLPPWVQRNGRQREVKPLTDALEAAMATGDPAKIEPAEDAVLKLMGSN